MRDPEATTQGKLAYGLPEAARTLDVSVAFLRLEIRRGHLQPARLGRRVVLPVSELNRYIEDSMRRG